MDTRKIIDYAANGDGTEMRDALYSAIHDRVSAHIESKKQEIAHSLIAQPEQTQDNSVENA